LCDAAKLATDDSFAGFRKSPVRRKSRPTLKSSELTEPCPSRIAAFDLLQTFRLEKNEHFRCV
jgi:hypothetical protein